MRYRAKIEVRLKPGYLDPEGESVKNLLKLLGYKVERAGVSKIYEVELEAKSPAEARRLTDEMCRKLLVNPVKDDYTLILERVR